MNLLLLQLIDDTCSQVVLVPLSSFAHASRNQVLSFVRSIVCQWEVPDIQFLNLFYKQQCEQTSQNLPLDVSIMGLTRLPCRIDRHEPLCRILGTMSHNASQLFVECCSSRPVCDCLLLLTAVYSCSTTHVIGLTSI